MSILKNKFTIFILGIIAVLILGAQLAFAQDKPVLVVSPASLTKNIGDSFNLAVEVRPAGQKICAVEGQLILSKLTSQKIDVAKGVISQTPPSFSNGFYFLLGIPGCTLQNKTLFTVRVKANAIGQSAASFRKVDIIGEGKSVSSDFNSGSYKIIIPETTAAGEKTTAPSIAKSCVCENWAPWQNKKCGEGDCLETQKLQIRNRNCSPSGCDIQEQTQCINDSTCITLARKPKINKESESNNPLLASVGSIITLGTGRAWVGILLALIIIILTIFFLSKKRKEVEKKEE